MKYLHPLMEKSWKLVPNGTAVKLLIRHSVRGPILPGEYGNSVPLTSQGRSLAADFGKMLGNSVGTIFSSPVGRCVETGQSILKGCGKEHLNVLTDIILGNPGPIIENPSAGKLFLENGSFWVIDQIMKGISLPGVASAKSGTDKMLNFIFRKKNQIECKTDIFITHDSILSPVIYFLMGYNRISKEDWPWMLEGAFLWKESDSLYFSWRGKLYHYKHTEN